LETHWALGKLFRRRGELERAIKIHQNLISRPTIAESERRQAMFELGLDYLAAGLYDRAEEMLLALQHDKQFSQACLRHLVELYESTHEWDKAIRAALKLLRYDSDVGVVRSEEHTSELQSRENLVCRPL